jgi:hypothetical protein
MLFWWEEEELMRWRLLDEEAVEIEKIVEGEEREERLAVVQARKRVMPSLRREDGTLKEGEGSRCGMLVSEGAVPVGQRANG